MLGCVLRRRRVLFRVGSSSSSHTIAPKSRRESKDLCGGGAIAHLARQERVEIVIRRLVQTEFYTATGQLLFQSCTMDATKGIAVPFHARPILHCATTCGEVLAVVVVRRHLETIVGLFSHQLLCVGFVVKHVVVVSLLRVAQLAPSDPLDRRFRDRMRTQTMTGCAQS